MSRHNVIVCDVCGRPTDRIVGALYWVPSIPGTVRLTATNYTHKADVGECCKDRLFTGTKFSKRQNKEEHQKSRRARVNRTTVRMKSNGD